MNSCIVRLVSLLFICTVQLASKFTARIGQNAYLARFFARHEELHVFDARVSRLLAHPTMLASCAARNLHVLTRIPTRDRFPVHKKFARESFHAIATSTCTFCEGIYVVGHLVWHTLRPWKSPQLITMFIIT